MVFDDKEKQRIEVLLKSCRITKSTAWYDKNIIPKIIEHKEKYLEVSRATGCPAAFVAMIHLRENGPDVGKFSAYLGNGQPLTKVTSLVPKGRGPFSSWAEGAIDALRLVGMDKVKSWTLERMIFEWERYNGFGYRQRNINAPYVWSFTNHYTRGKYVRDGLFNSDSVDGSPGCFAVYESLVASDASFDVTPASDLSDFPIVDESPELNAALEAAWLAFLSFFSAFFGKKSEPIAQDILNLSRNKKILIAASEEIGVKEISGPASNPRIEEYFDAASSSGSSPFKDDIPWCAAAVAFVLKKCGMQHTSSLMALSYKVWGKSVLKSGWAPGDIVVFERGAIGSGSGHVTFLLKINEDGSLVCLGGNQNDEFCISVYSPSRLVDIRRSTKEIEYTSAELKELHSIADDIIRGKKIIADGRMD